MKATVKQLATITFISLLLMVLNVRAEGTETTATASKNENVESALVLENWMTDSSIWNTSTALFIDTETETELSMENWMTNSESWNISFDVVDEMEPGLEMEEWMTSHSNWFIVPVENDSELQLENWMTDAKTWK